MPKVVRIACRKKGGKAKDSAIDEMRHKEFGPTIAPCVSGDGFCHQHWRHVGY
jgi:hypothetical protein